MEAMKSTFGSWFLRLMRGGDALSQAERQLVQVLVEHLPPELKEVVESQFDEYNLVQREVDGRALNFYRVASWRGGLLEPSRRLNLKTDDAALVRISATVGDSAKPIHAVLHAVGGRAFCVTFSARVPGGRHAGRVVVIKVTEAWRSNLTAPDGAQQPAAGALRPS